GGVMRSIYFHIRLFPGTDAAGWERGTKVNELSVQDLDYAVPEKQILQDIDLEIAPGQIVAVMGMSGSGKTTLLKCLAGLLKPSSGKILVENEDIVPLSESELDRVRLKIGLVFQYAALFDSLSVYDNVSFGLVNHRRMSKKETDSIVRERLAD